MRNEKENIKHELDELGASFLSHHKKENEAFQPPVNYFDELPARVQNHISTRKKMLWSLPGFVRWSPVFASVLIALVVTTYIIMQKNTSVQNNNTVAEVKIENAVNEEITETDILLDELDEDILIDAIADAEPVKTSAEKPVKKVTITAEKQEIEDYILENVDEYLLIEEL